MQRGSVWFLIRSVQCVKVGKGATGSEPKSIVVQVFTLEYVNREDIITGLNMMV